VRNILLFYKNSVYRNYFLSRSSSYFGKQYLFDQKELKRFKDAHLQHYKTLKAVEAILKRLKLPYQKCSRGSSVNYSKYDLVITIGGDGTFLEAARHVRKQIMLGVNSDPKRSVGRFSCATAKDFKFVFLRMLNGKAKIKNLNRLQLELSDNPKTKIEVLNDVLVCHESPAALSRYYITVNGATEEQRGSGVWVSTAIGSTGAIYSAGGKPLARTDKRVQYLARELLRSNNVKYRLRGGVVAIKSPIIIKSRMRLGKIFIDGAHISLPLSFGNFAKISISPYPLKVITK